jgi:hypothetical protein
MKLTDFVKVQPPARFTRDWSARIGGAEGKGSTAGEALLNLQKVIEYAFAEAYPVSVIPYRGSLGVVWKMPYGWLGRTMESNERKRLWGTASGFETEEVALKSIRFDLAQAEWDKQEESSPLIVDEEDQERFGAWARWRKRFADLAATGMDGTAIRERLREEGL